MPISHHECTDKFDDVREHQHPSEKQHRDHGGRDGPNNCDDGARISMRSETPGTFTRAESSPG